jgi:hypothetical protein
MDNRYLYFAPAELEYRRQRATHSVKRRKRRGNRTPWLGRNNLDTGWS